MKIKRSIEDLIKTLQQEHNFLKEFCKAYDNGNEHAAKKIALSLRILLHDTKNSQSILSQLGIKNTYKFLDTAHPYNEKNILPSNCLTEILISSDNSDKVLPLLAKNSNKNFQDFSNWWERIVLDDKKYKFSRKEIVLLVADKDGGAHVDSELPAHYYDLTRNNSMGWIVRIEGVEKPLEDFCFAAIRQIGFEINETLNALRIDLWRC